MHLLEHSCLSICFLDVIVVLELIAITGITTSDVGKRLENGFKLPGNLYLACEAQTPTFVELILTEEVLHQQGKRELLSLCKQAVTHSCWVMNLVAAKKNRCYRAVNQLQVLPLNESAFCKNSLEVATACGISGFTRSGDSCRLLRSKCNCFSKQKKSVKTLSKTQVLRWHSVIYQVPYWFMEIITTNWKTTTTLLAYYHLHSLPEG